MSRYTPREEKLNTWSHALGVVFSVIASYFLISKAVESNNIWAIVSYPVFMLFLSTMFLSSTLYHAEKDEQRKMQRRKFDHAAIYTQIAGSYTPYTLVVLRENEAWGWTFFGIIWAAAVFGVALSFLSLKKGSKLETIGYVAMGWVVVVAFKPLIDVFQQTDSMNVLWWLIAGGGFYTVGAVLYQFKKIRYMHGIWHLFVLGGTVCHVVAVWLIKL